MTDGNTVQPSDSEQAPSVSTKKEETLTPATTDGRKNESSWLRRFFWLDERVTEAKKASFGPNSPGFSEFEMAKQVHAGVVQIGETGESNGAVLMLERIEVLALSQSHLLHAGLPCVGRAHLTEADFEKLRTLPRFLEVWNELSIAQQNALTVALGPDAERGVIGLDAKNRRYLASGLRKLSSVLTDPLEFEANRVGRVLFIRWARIGAAAVAALGLVLSMYGAYAKATAKPNLALHRPVTISSQFPGEGTDHSLLVDGDTTNLGFHTGAGPNQFCTIDLGSVKAISKVVVTNRADCCQERAVPLNLEVSVDGVNYRKVAERRDLFDSWSAENLNTKARYVKLTLGSSNFLHLSEVEVY
jgi:hypothetical protein